MTQTPMAEYNFAGGMGTEIAQQGQGAKYGNRLEYLSLKGDPASVAQGRNVGLYRMLTDMNADPSIAPQNLTAYDLPWITVPQHFVSTKDKPPYVSQDRKWQAKASGVCRKGVIFAATYGNQCFLCDQAGQKAKNQTWALGVEREKVYDEGREVGTRDKSREIISRDANGEPIKNGDDFVTEWVPAYVIFNQSWGNFFLPIQGVGNYFQGSVLGVDLLITRTGDDKSTIYTPMPLQTPSLPPPDNRPYDFRDRGLMREFYPDLPDLREIIAAKTTDDYYGYWFIPGWTPPGWVPGQNQGQQGQAPQAPMVPGQPMQGGYPQQQGGYPAQPQGQEPPTQAVTALRDRVLGDKQPQQPQQQPQQPAQQQPQQAPQQPPAGQPAPQQTAPPAQQQPQQPQQPPPPVQGPPVPPQQQQPPQQPPAGQPPQQG